MTEHEAARRRPVAWGAWSRLVIASLARVIVLSILGGLFWSIAPNIIGWRPTTVMSDSMAPRFFTGDVAVSMPASATNESIGSILLVDDPDHPGRLRLHRMYDVTPEGEIVTKGDANAQPDSSHVTQDHVRGVAVMRIPFVGMPLVWARYGQWPLVALAGIGFLGLVVLSCIDGDLRRSDAPVRPSTRRERRRRLRRDRVMPPILLVGSASAVALVLAVTTGAHAAFAAKISNSTSNWTSATDFACWPTTTAADSPYFYYRFNTTASPTVDASANNRTGALGTGTASAAGVCPTAGASPARTFDGTANGTVTPAASAAITGPNTFSLEAWFKTTTAGGKIIGFGDFATGSSNSFDRQLYIGTDGKVYFGVYPNAVRTIVSTAALNNGAWHHVIATLSTAGMKLYVDGALVASSTATTTGQSYSGYWRIGYDTMNTTWTNGSTPGFVGTLDNVAVYTTALTAAQVTAHYNVGH